MNKKALALVSGGKSDLITLGSWGGYIVVGFDHTIANVAGKRDFRVLGNSLVGGSEAGIVYVAYDKNKNGKPDTDEWYEIAGSATLDPTKTYYPQWNTESYYTLSGTRLPQKGYNKQTAENPFFVCLAFGYGYADNVPNTDKGATIDIDWAIDKAGKPVHLPGVDFVRVQTGVLQVNGWLGENSTEFAGIQDLHVLKENIPTK